MIKNYHKIKNEHLKRVKEEFKEYGFSEDFLIKMLRYPFYFIALHIEGNNLRPIHLNNFFKIQLKPKAKEKMSIWGTIRAVYTGARNMVYKQEDVERMSEQRLEICRQCPLYTSINDLQGGEGNNSLKHEYCDPKKTTEIVKRGNPVTIRGCGCNLSVKTRNPTDTCPAGKWRSVGIDIDNSRIIKTKEDLENWNNEK